MKKLLATVALLPVLWGVKFGLNLIWFEASDEPKAEEWSEWAAEEDSWVEESLRDGSSAPARGWLDAEDHVTFEASSETMDELIEKMYAAGAENVWVVFIEEWQGREISDSIAVELPPAGPAREQIFAAAEEFWGGDPPQDVGQSYLTISFD